MICYFVTYELRLHSSDTNPKRKNVITHCHPLQFLKEKVEAALVNSYTILFYKKLQADDFIPDITIIDHYYSKE